MKEALYIAAAAQLSVAVLNLFLVRIMKWEEEVARMPQLVREVFHVHAWFITITLAIFGVVTIRFAEELATGANVPLPSYFRNRLSGQNRQKAPLHLQQGRLHSP